MAIIPLKTLCITSLCYWIETVVSGRLIRIVITNSNDKRLITYLRYFVVIYITTHIL